MEQSQQYQLGPWIICPRTNSISNQQDSHTLDNKSMQLLVLLIAHQKETVTKNQIFEHVWKGKFVADDILSVTVSKIRKALGDDARSPTFIKTLPGVGYVLVADAIKRFGSDDPSSLTSKTFNIRFSILFILIAAGIGLAYLFAPNNQPPANPLDINSIAVLPFDDLSESKDNQYFTDGVSDAIINQLSQIQSLKVISRYSSFTYRGNYNATDIGKALRVDTLLDGSVQIIEDKVRINVRIFSTQSGQQLWSKTFDGNDQDIFRLQDDISANIQAIIQPAKRPNTRPIRAINAQAYEWYLMGQYHWRQRNPESLTKALTYFKHSLESEPDYADAHVGMSITYQFLHTYGNWSEKRAIDAAQPHINRALELEPNSATALAAKGLLLTEKAIYLARSGQADPAVFQQAQSAYERSLELDNNATTHQWFAALLRRTGSDAQVIEHLNKAIELNPLSASLKRAFSFELLSMGKPDTAQKMFQRALALEPDYVSRLVESSRINRYTQQSILDMSAWHKNNPALFTNCSSDEYCEHIVFTYLSIGADEMANKVLSNMGSTHFHFRTSLNAISASAKGNDVGALRAIERFVQWRSANRPKSFSYAVAQFRAKEYQQAKDSLLHMHPQWRETGSIVLAEISADNYQAMVLYAATLLSLQQNNAAEELLKNVRDFLLQDSVFDKTQAQFSLAEIHAQLGNKSKALEHLAIALEMGWMETFSNEWWTLANSHLLRPLQNEPQFQLLLEQHQAKRKALRDAVTLAL